MKYAYEPRSDVKPTDRFGRTADGTLAHKLVPDHPQTTRKDMYGPRPSSPFRDSAGSRTERELRAELENTQKLLGAKTAELKDLQAYFARTDSVSHTDVLRSLSTLNSEIFQASMQLTDDCSFGKELSTVRQAELAPALKELTGRLGKQAIDLITLPNNKDCREHCVPWAVQTLLTQCVNLIISCWELDLPYAWERAARRGPDAPPHERALWSVSDLIDRSGASADLL